MGSSSANIQRLDSLSVSVQFADLQLGLDIGDDDVDMGYDDGDDDDTGEEFLCPFCANHYDVVALCCHIDEQHPLQAHNGVCPLCAKMVVGADFVGHITEEHGKFLRMQQRPKRLRKGSPSSSMLIKELEEEASLILESLYGGGSSSEASSNCEPDPLLLSFILNPVVADEPRSAQPCLFEATQETESSQEDLLGRKPEELQRLDLDKDQVENARRFEFVQGLLMSTLLDDNL